MNSKESKVTPSVQQGVGGRQGGSAPLQGGGGYQDIYTDLKPEPSDDPRIRELKQIGMNPRWIEVAEAIGYEGFIKMWRILDQENLRSGFRQSTKITVPLFSKLIRWHRNQVLRTMAAADSDISPQELIACSERQFNMPLAERTLRRILQR